MTLVWNKHRFSGGLLVLDLVNTVVHRLKPDMVIDRFADQSDVRAFIEAARTFRTEEAGGHALAKDGAQPDLEALVDLREAANAVFRPKDKEVADTSAGDLHRLLDAAARLTRPKPDGESTEPFGLSCALSAVKLIGSSERMKVRACRNCDWLYIDRSRNQSRLWCDMAVCGNRAKAARHYQSTRVKREAGKP